MHKSLAEKIEQFEGNRLQLSGSTTHDTGKFVNDILFDKRFLDELFERYNLKLEELAEIVEIYHKIHRQSRVKIAKIQRINNGKSFQK